jgi:hypothetical protein
MPLLQLQTVLIVAGGLVWPVKNVVPRQGLTVATERTHAQEKATESYEAAILVIGTGDKETRTGSERRRTCFGQFS